jgi:DNA-binding Lrp family transcriptional regulator
MRESATLDDLDVRIVAALQVAPRADWQRIGKAVQVSASTVARRWARMTEAGLAWTSCHPMRVPGISPTIAFIEVDCAPAKLYSVANHLINDPHVLNAAHVTGTCDLLLTAVFADHASLARYVGFRLGYLDGVVANRAQIVTRLHTDGTRWRLHRLTEQQTAILHRGRPDRPAAPELRTDPDNADMALMTALSTNCRLPIVDLAEQTGMSPTTIQRRLARLEADRILIYRCDVAQHLSGWPETVTLRGSVSPSDTTTIASQLSGLREVRMCVSTTGHHNLSFTLWLRSLDQLPALEARLATRIPDLTVAERIVTLWRLKIGGHILDPEGRHLRFVPVQAWPDNNATQRETSFVDHLRTG